MEETDDDPALDQTLEIADENLDLDLDPVLVLDQIPEIEFQSDLIVEEMMMMLLVPKRRKVDGIDLGLDLILDPRIEKIELKGKGLIVDLMTGERLRGRLGGVGLLVMILGIDRCDVI